MESIYIYGPVLVVVAIAVLYLGRSGKPRQVEQEEGQELSPIISCADCGKDVSRRASACPGCGAPVAAAVSAVAAGGLACQQCGGEMHSHKFSEGNYKVVIGLLVVILGIVLVFSVPVFGWIIGLILVIVGLGMGGKRRSGWKCQACGYFFEAR